MVCRQIYSYRCSFPGQDEALVSWKTWLPAKQLCRRRPGFLLGSERAQPAVCPGSIGGQ